MRQAADAAAVAAAAAATAAAAVAAVAAAADTAAAVCAAAATTTAATAAGFLLPASSFQVAVSALLPWLHVMLSRWAAYADVTKSSAVITCCEQRHCPSKVNDHLESGALLHSSGAKM